MKLTAVQILYCWWWQCCQHISTSQTCQIFFAIFLMKIDATEVSCSQHLFHCLCLHTSRKCQEVKANPFLPCCNALYLSSGSRTFVSLRVHNPVKRKTSFKSKCVEWWPLPPTPKRCVEWGPLPPTPNKSSGTEHPPFPVGHRWVTGSIHIESLPDSRIRGIQANFWKVRWKVHLRTCIQKRQCPS